MTRMFSANAEARTLGKATFAMAVFDGPVFRKRKNTEMNIRNQAAGKGVKSMATKNGNAASIPTADTRKYEPGYLLRRRSPNQPPASVDVNPATTMISPKNCV